MSVLAAALLIAKVLVLVHKEGRKKQKTESERDKRETHTTQQQTRLEGSPEMFYLQPFGTNQ